MSDFITINDVPYYGKVVRAGCRNHHPMSEYVGKRKFDVAKLESDDSWTYWYIFESQMPLPYESNQSNKLGYASWMDVDRDDHEAPGQLFRRRANIWRMGVRKVLITQSGGRDI